MPPWIDCPWTVSRDKRSRYPGRGASAIRFRCRAFLVGRNRRSTPSSPSRSLGGHRARRGAVVDEESEGVVGQFGGSESRNAANVRREGSPCVHGAGTSRIRCQSPRRDRPDGRDAATGRDAGPNDTGDVRVLPSRVTAIRREPYRRPGAQAIVEAAEMGRNPSPEGYPRGIVSHAQCGARRCGSSRDCPPRLRTSPGRSASAPSRGARPWPRRVDCVCQGKGREATRGTADESGHRCPLPGGPWEVPGVSSLSLGANPVVPGLGPCLSSRQPPASSASRRASQVRPVLPSGRGLVRDELQGCLGVAASDPGARGPRRDVVLRIAGARGRGSRSLGHVSSVRRRESSECLNVRPAGPEASREQRQGAYHHHLAAPARNRRGVCRSTLP